MNFFRFVSFFFSVILLIAASEAFLNFNDLEIY